MSMIRRNVYWPFRVLDSFFDDVWEPFDFTLLRIPEMEYPKLDIKEEDKEYLITVEVPGFTKEEVNIEVNDDLLNISSEHKEEKEEEKEGYIHRERFHRSFSRSLRIPENIIPEDIDAKLENGLLTLKLPKREPEPPKKIEIKDPEELKELENKESELKEA
ncbi:MAG TPA: Hsp20/alpha crystallin family protein [Candidatus Deferrimicrobium sp.]|nr:Hsp20/alpha crystallin family protein [Candidatus Deferrimicrobium sp.]